MLHGECRASAGQRPRRTTPSHAEQCVRQGASISASCRVASRGFEWPTHVRERIVRSTVCGARLSPSARLSPATRRQRCAAIAWSLPAGWCSTAHAANCVTVRRVSTTASRMSRARAPLQSLKGFLECRLPSPAGAQTPTPPCACRRRVAARLRAAPCCSPQGHRRGTPTSALPRPLHVRPAAAAGAAPRVVLASAWALWGLGAASREQSKRSETTRAIQRSTRTHSLFTPATLRRFFASLFDRALATQHRARCSARPRQRAQEPPCGRMSSSRVSGLMCHGQGRGRRAERTCRPVRAALA